MNSVPLDSGSALRLPSSLLNVDHRLVARDGVHIYTAQLPPCMWRRERFAHAAIVVMNDGATALARWKTPSGKQLCDLSAGDVWVIPPAMETTCEFHGVTDLMMIFVDPCRLPKMPASQVRMLADNCTAAPLDGYIELEPMLRDVHYVLVQQSHGRPHSQVPGKSIDEFKCATVFARQVWLLHYVGLRVTLDKISPAQVVQELQAP
ncbi:MAG: hypothetical protein Q8M02_11835 [Candidatus Didemnitutus sp.]|nr:hypothetical protein [Candidatus Didemnitutus sp.]